MTERRPVSLPVSSVTVLEDRAHVVRRGRVRLQGGLARFAVPGDAPVLADKTLAARAVAGGARVTDVRAVRSVVEVADDGPTARLGRELDARYDALGRELEALSADERLATAARASHERLLALTLGELAVDSAWGRAPSDEAAPALAELRAGRTAAILCALELGARRAELVAERDRLRERLSRLRAVGGERARGRGEGAPLFEREAATLELDVHADAAAEIELEVSYLVPGACWRPYHGAELVGGSDGRGAKVVFRTDGCVWQHTGEDWPDVELVFSTERASLGIEPPELTSDVLRVERRREAIEIERRQEVVETTGLGAAAFASELPGIDDGGAPLRLGARARTSVPSDGRPHRVPIAELVTAAELEQVAVPELSPCVFTKSVQALGGTVPILAGPVDLVRESGFVGRTRVLFVAPGERFVLGWGPDPELRVKRSVRETPPRAEGVLGAWRTREHEVELRLSNLGPTPRRLRVTERVPVSELEKVKVELDPSRTSGGGTQADADGFVHFVVELAPFGREKVTLGYAVSTHEDVVGG
ncbi:MAG: mucoidy inhibitor MuiA family protein [Myxococcales bacterium]|nr:mucoidy inhibitor MuiA family protein [Myxococcales bacterium]